MTRSKKLAVVAVSVVFAALLVVVVASLRGGDDHYQARGIQTATAPVTRENLAAKTSLQGTVVYDGARELPNRKSGIVTAVPETGAVVRRGEILYKVNDSPVVALFGSTPVYRPLALGISGKDVKQLKQNLAALGYRGLGTGESYSAQTAAVVKKWQKKLGATETGAIDPADVTVVAGEIRIAQHKAAVGDEASGPVVAVTNTDRIVSVGVPAEQQYLAREGAEVTVVPGDGVPVKGTISEIGEGAGSGAAGPPGSSSASDAGSDKLTVAIKLSDPGRIAEMKGAVQVQFVSEQRTNVLTVPVTALLALRDGYGVAIIDRGERRVVAVTTGMFADGRVEVDEAQIAEGAKVEVPLS